MAHDDFPLLRRLLIALDHPRADIYLHVDERVRNAPLDVLEEAVTHSDLIVIPRRVVRWSGYSQVEAELALLAAAIPAGYAYHHLLSGHDLPITPHDEFYGYFDAHPGIEYVDCWARVDNGLLTERYLRRLKYFYPFEPGSRASKTARAALRAVGLIQRAIGVNRLRGTHLPFCYGANWFSITGGLARYVLESRPLIEKHFRWTRSPDEMFLQTISLASPYRDRLYQNNHDGRATWSLRFVDWTRAGEHPHSPHVIRADDFDAVIASGCLFARKFDSFVDDAVIDRMVEHVRAG